MVDKKLNEIAASTCGFLAMTTRYGHYEKRERRGNLAFMTLSSVWGGAKAPLMYQYDLYK